MESLESHVAHAVESLHADLALWLGSEAAPSVHERVMEAQHPDFSMVSADGEVISRSQLAANLRQAGNAVPGLTINVDELSVLAGSGELIVVRFTESHHHDGHTERRRTTAVLTGDPAAGPLRWLAVHETAGGRPAAPASAV
ncbi:MAG: hypothetical protein ACRD0P_16230 [Stackebrandtia sp.]